MIKNREKQWQKNCRFWGKHFYKTEMSSKNCRSTAQTVGLATLVWYTLGLAPLFIYRGVHGYSISPRIREDMNYLYLLERHFCCFYMYPHS